MHIKFGLLLYGVSLIFTSCRINHIHKCDFTKAIVLKTVQDIDNEFDTGCCIFPRLERYGHYFEELRTRYDLELIDETNKMPINIYTELSNRSCELDTVLEDYIMLSPVFTKDREKYIIYQIELGEQRIVLLKSFKVNSKCKIINLRTVDGYILWN